jgi:hypothetical protein
MDFDATIWGPHFWFMLHTMSLIYPKNPNAVIKKKYYDFIQNLPAFIPEKESSENFANLLDLYPITPYLDSKESLIKWMHFIHNKINEILKKKKITIDEFYATYYEQYKPKPTQFAEYKRWREKVIYFAMVGLIIGVSYYLYKE